MGFQTYLLWIISDFTVDRSRPALWFRLILVLHSIIDQSEGMFREGYRLNMGKGGKVINSFAVLCIRLACSIPPID